MNLWRCVAVVAAGVIGLHAGYAIAESSYTLDVSAGATLRSVFDAGFRPKNIRGMDRLTCLAGKCDLNLIVAPSLRFHTPADRVEFNVKADDSISQISVVGPNLTYRDAANAISNVLGGAGAMPERVAAKLQQAQQEHSFEPLRDVQEHWHLSNGANLTVMLIPGDFDPTNPRESHLRLRILVNWNEVSAHKQPRKEPIKPPPGYEQYSMAPESPAPQAPPSATPLVASAVTTASASEAPPATAEASVSATEPQVRHRRSRSGLRKIIVAIVVVAVLASVAVFWINRKRAKVPPGPT